MRLGRTAIALLLLCPALSAPVLAQEPKAQTKQAPEAVVLPVLTEAQAWQRAAYNFSYFTGAAILQGREHGQKPEAVGKFMGEIAAESWNIPAGVDRAAFFARGMGANLQIWPGAAPSVVEATPGAVTVRFNPVFYRKAFADKEMPSGVTVGDYEAFFQGLMDGLGSRLGLQVTVFPGAEESRLVVKQVTNPKP